MTQGPQTWPDDGGGSVNGRTALVLVMAMTVLAGSVPGAWAGGQTVRGSIEVGGLRRTYGVHVPASLRGNEPAALVLVFHGGGGDGAGVEHLTHFSEPADREGFLVVYPDGFAKNWNDGRDASVSKAHRDNIDDVGFISALIGSLTQQYRVDPKRVFATGISNGGIFSHYLAAHLCQRIAAIAPVAGGIAEEFRGAFKPSSPVSVLILQGTGDPLVLYHGGGILRGKRGRIIDTDQAVKLWVKTDGCGPQPRTGALPDSDPNDGCLVRWSTWGNGRDGTEVTLYTIEGGGHTWPGGAQYLPAFVIGRVCRDFDGTEAIWAFFKAHPKP